jgi:putative tryptophan/tyrosine transport system permease protein
MVVAHINHLLPFYKPSKRMINLGNLLQTSLELGFQYCIVTVALIVSFKIIRFPDLSVDGTFALGGAITAVFTQNFNEPFLGLFITIFLGAVVGALTACLNIYLKINRILSGILMMISLYSVNLRIMSRSNIPLSSHLTLISKFEVNQTVIIIFFFVVAFFVGSFLLWLLKTEFGLILRVTGDNPRVVKNNGRNVKFYTIAGLSISSSLVALAGSLVAQRQGYADVNMGVGIIIIGLACLFIGDSVVRPRTLPFLILSAIVGTIIYEFLISLGLRVGLHPSDLKIITAIMVVIALSVFNKSKQPIIEENISMND